MKKCASPVALARRWRMYFFPCVVGLHFILPNQAGGEGGLFVLFGHDGGLQGHAGDD